MKLRDRFKGISLFQYPRVMVELYEEHEGRIGSAIMMVGFITDFILFHRIDQTFELVVLVGYLSIAAFGITIVNLYEGGRMQWRWLSRIRLWLPLSIQYAFGGLFSAFVIFYIKSASFATSWPFLLILIAILFGNEYSRKRYIKLVFHMSVFFLALFSFMIFFLPIALKQIGPWVFFASGLVSLGIIALFIRWLLSVIPERINQGQRGLIISIVGIYLALNGLYFTNVIPPIPLALNDQGVYHNIISTGSTYTLQGESQRWYHLFIPYDTIHITPGSPVYAFGSVFAPTDLNTTIQHHWQRKDPITGSWVTVLELPYKIVGGREAGYRGWSVSRRVSEGDWRVDIETDRGQDIGRIRFKVKEVDTTPPLETLTK